MEPLIHADLAVAAELHHLVALPTNWLTLTAKERERMGRDILSQLRERYDKGDKQVREFARLHPSILPRGYARETRCEPPHVPRPKICVRNCLYHVYPTADNDQWRVNVKQLRKRAHVFNGRCVAAIAMDAKCVPLTEVLRAFAGSAFEFVVLPNDCVLREQVTFLPLLLHVAEPSPHVATFYAHTKGNATQDGEVGARYWRNAMYVNLLDRWGECMDSLNSDMFDMCGTHKMVWGDCERTLYPSGLRVGAWHFAGTYFWFRNDYVFSEGVPWRKVPADRYGVEAWPSIVCPDWTRGRSMFQLWGEGVGEFWGKNPYDIDLYPPEYRTDFV